MEAASGATAPDGAPGAVAGEESRASLPLEHAAQTFEDLYDAHFDFVWRSARRLGVQHDSIDDVVQDVFFVAYRRQASFEGRSSVRGWLYGILRRVLSERRRRRARKRTEPLYHEPAGPASEGPLHAVEQARAAARVHAALDTLSASFRDVLVLADLEQMTAPEIAEALDLKLNTVYSRLRVARQRFEAALREQTPLEAGANHG